MTGFNIGLPGNTAIDQMITKGTMPVEEAQYWATLAVAFELRTKNLIAAQATPYWLDDVRARLGNPTAPAKEPLTVKEMAQAPDQRCELRLMDGRNEIRCWLKKDHAGDCK